MAARTTSREEIRAHVTSAVSPRTIGNSLIAAGLRSHVPQAAYHLHHDTAKHGYCGVVKESAGEWNGALLSSVMSVRSVCMRVMNVDVYSIDLVRVIFRRAFPHDTQAPPQDSWCVGTISYNSRSPLVFLQGKVNSARYIAQDVYPATEISSTGR